MNKRGFTLIELLLGFLIFGLVMGAVVSVFWAGLRMNERGAKQNKKPEEARRTLEWLVHDLENMVDFDMSGISQDKKAFIGDKDTITFVLPSGNGLKSVRYYLEEPTKVRIFQTIIGETTSKNKKIIESKSGEYRTQYLVREVTEFKSFISGENTSGDKEVLFIHSFSGGVTFQYAYAQNKESRDIEWRNKWEENYIPLGIKVELRFLEKDGAAPITLTRKILIPTGSLGGIQKAEQSNSNQSPSNIFQNLFQNIPAQNSGSAPSNNQIPIPLLDDDINQSTPAINNGQAQGGVGVNLQDIIGQFLNPQSAP